MTAPGNRRRRVPLAELYVVVCTGLAALVALGVAPPVSTAVLLVLLLPFAVVGFALALNGAFLAGDGLGPGWTGAALVVAVAVLAGLQAWGFRAMARNWRRTDVEMHAAPVTTGADTGA
jgi:hypothetical protein